MPTTYNASNMRTNRYRLAKPTSDLLSVRIQYCCIEMTLAWSGAFRDRPVASDVRQLPPPGAGPRPTRGDHRRLPDGAHGGRVRGPDHPCGGRGRRGVPG